jgi:hypothetical protein
MGDKHNKKPSGNERGRDRNGNHNNQNDNQEPSNVARSLAEDFEQVAQEDFLASTAVALYLLTRIASLFWLSQQVALGKFDPVFLAAALRTYNLNTNTPPSIPESRLTETVRSNNRNTQLSSINTTEDEFVEEDNIDNRENTTYVSAADITHSIHLSRKSALLSSFRTSGSISTDSINEEDYNTPTTSAREELEIPQAPVVTRLEDGSMLINGQLFAEQDTHTPPPTPRRPSTPETPPTPVKKPRNETDSDDNQLLDDSDIIDTDGTAEEDEELLTSPIPAPLLPDDFFSDARHEAATEDGDEETAVLFEGQNLFGNDYSDDDLPGSHTPTHDHQ